MRTEVHDLKSSKDSNFQAGDVTSSLSSPKEFVVIKWISVQLSIWDYWIKFKEGKVTPDVWYQRLYRYIDIVGKSGHEFQRKFMKSMITFDPIPTIWLNVLEFISHIIDGGHRTRIIDGWFRNCIRLPKETYVFFSGQMLNLSEMNWSDVEKHHSEYAEYWKHNYMLDFKEGQNLSDEECAEKFENLNDNNDMAPQEFRTSIISKLNKYILDKTNHELKNSLKIFQLKNLVQDTKKYFISKQHKINFSKRGFDSFVAKVFFLVKTQYSQPLSEKKLTDMYKEEREIESFNKQQINPDNIKKTQLEQYQTKVNSVLSWVDNLLMGDSSVKGALTPNEIFLLLHTKFEIENSYRLSITNEKQFLDTYRRIMKNFKTDDKITSTKNKKWIWKNSKGEPTSFSKSLSSIATGRPSEFKEWRGIVAGEFVNEFNKENKGQPIGFELLPKKDEKRVYNSSEKDSMASVQDFECMYFEYCGNHVDGIDETIAGDHSTVSHTHGGMTDIENGAACCTKCNQEKSSLSHDEFLAVLKIRGLSDDDITKIQNRKSKVEEYSQLVS